MSSTSPKLGLTVPATTDLFSTSTIAGNWNLIDASPGVWSGTYSALVTKVAAYSSAQAGMTFWDTTNRYLWIWNGSALYRPFANGLLPVQTTQTTGAALSSTPATIVSSSAYSVTSTNTPIWTPQFVIPPMARSVRFDIFIQGIAQTAGGSTSFGAPVYMTPCTTYPASLNHTTPYRITNSIVTYVAGESGGLSSSFAVNIASTTAYQTGGIASLVLNANTDASGHTATVLSGAITVVATEI